MSLSLEDKPKSAQLVIPGLGDLTSGHHCESQYRTSIRKCVRSWWREVWEYSEPRKTPFFLFYFFFFVVLRSHPEEFPGWTEKVDVYISYWFVFFVFQQNPLSLQSRCDLLLRVLAVSGNSPARNYQQMNHSFGKVANSLGNSSGTAVKSAVVLFASCLH